MPDRSAAPPLPAAARAAAGAAGNPWVRVGAYAIMLDDARRLLLVLGAPAAAGTRAWWLPGGGLEFGEDPEVAVRRELLEETGLVGVPEEVVGTFSTVYDTSVERPGDPVHVVGIVYRVRIVGGALRPEAAGSSERCAWVTEREAAALPLSPGARFAVRLAWPGVG